MVGFIASRLTGVPLIATVHGWTRRNTLVRSLEICDKILLKHIEKVVIVSWNLLPEMDHISSKKIVTILNGVALEDRTCEGSSEFLRGPDTPSKAALTVGVFARLSPEKGHHYLLRTCALISHQFPGLRVLVVGDGPLEPKLRKLAVELGIPEKVIFTGFQEDATRIMRNVDVVVVPSLREASPLQVIEALFLNKAIISTDVGDIPRIAGGCKNVHIVPRGSTEALRLAMVDLFHKKLKGESLTSNGRSRVEEKFSAARMAEEYAAVYGSVSENISKPLVFESNCGVCHRAVESSEGAPQGGELSNRDAP